jgi:hypothetical protein
MTAEDRRQPGTAIVREGDLETALAQILDQQRRRLPVVLDTQNPLTILSHEPIVRATAAGTAVVHVAGGGAARFRGQWENGAR